MWVVVHVYGKTLANTGKYWQILVNGIAELTTLEFIQYPKKGKRKVQGVPQSQTAALPRPQVEEETNKSKQAQTEQMYEKH